MPRFLNQAPDGGTTREHLHKMSGECRHREHPNWQEYLLLTSARIGEKKWRHREKADERENEKADDERPPMTPSLPHERIPPLRPPILLLRAHSFAAGYQIFWESKSHYLPNVKGEARATRGRRFSLSESALSNESPTCEIARPVSAWAVATGWP
jgi:hypothetical protein